MVSDQALILLFLDYVAALWLQRRVFGDHCELETRALRAIDLNNWSYRLLSKIQHQNFEILLSGLMRDILGVSPKKDMVYVQCNARKVKEERIGGG